MEKTHKDAVIRAAKTEASEDESVAGLIRADSSGGVEYWLVVQKSENEDGAMLCNEKYFVYDSEDGSGYYTDNGINRREVPPALLAEFYEEIAETGSSLVDMEAEA